MSDLDESPITSNKPLTVVLTPAKEFNPQESAIWKALQEIEPQPDPEKVRNFTSMKEHQPCFSGVYQTPALDVLIQRRSASPQPPSLRVDNPQLSGRRSPVADLLPGGAGSQRPATQDISQSLTRAAALEGAQPVDPDAPLPELKVPLFETNSIGGRKKIAQSTSFNKVMMDMLGE